MKITINKPIASENMAPFIGLNKPFVGHIVPGDVPFIGLNAPLVPIRGKVGGFTLVELMITLAIVGILVAIGLPRMQEFILNNRLVGATNDFLVEFLYARGEAIKRSSTVTICKRDSAQTSPTCNNVGDDWSSGWYTFLDKDGDGVIGAGEEVLRQTTNPAVSVTAGTRIANSILFNRYGLARFEPNASSTDPDDRRFKLFDSRGCSASRGRSVEITNTGHAKTITGC